MRIEFEKMKRCSLELHEYPLFLHPCPSTYPACKQQCIPPYAHVSSRTSVTKKRNGEAKWDEPAPPS